MRYKALPTEFEVNEQQRIVSGYASAFGNVDQGGDRVLPGAFTKTLQERGNRLKVLWQHSPFEPIGKPLEVREDSHGLFTKSQISNTTLGRDLITLMLDEVIDSMSIGYDTVKESWNEGVRDLVELKLFEYSPVTFAMNEMAIITDVKRLNVEQIEEIVHRLQSFADHGLKAGRVLSKRNLTLVKQAYEALGALIEAGGADEEPEKSTPVSSEAKVEAAGEPDESTPQPLSELVTEIKALGGWVSERKLLEELQEFGRSLHEGN